jgi:hypothetical protein
MYVLIHAQKIDGEPFPAARYTIVLSWLIECHPRSPQNWRTEATSWSKKARRVLFLPFFKKLNSR